MARKKVTNGLDAAAEMETVADGGGDVAEREGGERGESAAAGLDSAATGTGAVEWDSAAAGAGAVGRDSAVAGGGAEALPVAALGGGACVLTNCTDSPRGLSLSRGLMVLGPREMRSLGADEYAEVRKLLRTEMLQRLVDSGIFRLSGLGDDEASIRVQTPAPPAILAEAVPVPELSRPVSVASAPAIVEHQNGGPLET